MLDTDTKRTIIKIQIKEVRCLFTRNKLKIEIDKNYNNDKKIHYYYKVLTKIIREQ